MTLRAAVVPCAGLGTRLLPLSKAVPKELLPLVDRPAIEWVALECAAAGLSCIVIVGRAGKESVAEHLRPMPELEELLRADGKDDLADAVAMAGAGLEVAWADQADPLGLGHAIGAAREAVGGDDFFVGLLPDDIYPLGTSPLHDMIALHVRTGAGVLSVVEIDDADTERYGVIAVEPDADGLLWVTDAIEKPGPERAPSRYGIMGRYLLPTEVFDHIDALSEGALGELQLTDALARLARTGRKLLALPTEMRPYDLGTKEGWLRAQVEAARDMGFEIR